ncbi:hypothetical protein JCM10449v2_001824 [Rhodotorula kratochvilovae]
MGERGHYTSRSLKVPAVLRQLQQAPPAPSTPSTIFVPRSVKAASKKRSTAPTLPTAPPSTSTQETTPSSTSKASPSSDEAPSPSPVDTPEPAATAPSDVDPSGPSLSGELVVMISELAVSSPVLTEQDALDRIAMLATVSVVSKAGCSAAKSLGASSAVFGFKDTPWYLQEKSLTDWLTRRKAFAARTGVDVRLLTVGWKSWTGDSPDVLSSTFPHLASLTVVNVLDTTKLLTGHDKLKELNLIDIEGPLCELFGAYPQVQRVVMKNSRVHKIPLFVTNAYLSSLEILVVDAKEHHKHSPFVDYSSTSPPSTLDALALSGVGYRYYRDLVSSLQLANLHLGVNVDNIPALLESLSSPLVVLSFSFRSEDAGDKMQTNDRHDAWTLEKQALARAFSSPHLASLKRVWFNFLSDLLMKMYLRTGYPQELRCIKDEAYDPAQYFPKQGRYGTPPGAVGVRIWSS